MPSIRVPAHLGRVDDILERHRQQHKEVPVRISSVSAGAVTALHHPAQELDLAGRINRAISPDRDVHVRDALTEGESLVAAMIARACAPRSKRIDKLTGVDPRTFSGTSLLLMALRLLEAHA